MNDNRFLHAMKSAWRTAVWMLAGVGIMGSAWAQAGVEPAIMFGRQRLAAKVLDEEVAVVPAAGRTLSSSSVRSMALSAGSTVSATARYAVLKMGPGTASRQSRQEALRQKASAAGSRIAPVLLLADGESRLVCTGELVACFPPELTADQVKALEAKYGLTRERAIDLEPNTYVYSVPDTMAVVTLSNQMTDAGEVVYAYPQHYNGGMGLAAFTANDPLFGSQWHLKNTGQGGGEVGADCNIGNIWNLYRGSRSLYGEVAAVVDDRVEFTHEDLINVVGGLTYDFTGVGSFSTLNHGTAVAGVLGGYGGNYKGITGVAPRGLMVGHQVFASGIFLLTEEEEALALSRGSNYIDIYTNSWGPTSGMISPVPVSPLTAAAFKNGVTSGRQGLGTIFLFAGGNYAELGDNVNYSAYANSQYTICVAASNNFGLHSYYSNPGCAILVNAPSNGGSLGIVTTDYMGTAGNAFGNYDMDFGGTSSATPLVAGVVMLMLQANPKLTWQEVQHILLTTAKQNAPTDGSWERQGANGAPARFPYSHLHGFGRVDAEKAVKTAANFLSQGPRQRKVAEKSQVGPGANTPENIANLGTRYQMDFQNSPNLFIEHVDVTLDITGGSGMHITLESPWGTRSVLSPGGGSGNYYTYSSVRHYGEGVKLGEFEDFESDGVWYLYIATPFGGPTDGFATLNYWKMSFYGREDLDNGGFGDGLPDDWEVMHFGNNVNLDDILPTGDNNGDGKTNWQHFIDGTDPAGRALVIYRLTDNLYLEGGGARDRINRYGLLVRDYASDDLVSVVSIREGSNQYYYEEHWGQSTETGVPGVYRYKAESTSAQREILATVDYVDGSPVDLTADQFTSRVLLGNNVQDASSIGLTRVSLAHALDGKLVTSDSAAEIYGDGSISLRLDKTRTKNASRSNMTIQRVVTDYKKELDKRSQVERLLLLDVTSSTLSEAGGVVTGTVTRATRVQGENPQEGVGVNLFEPLTVTLAINDPGYTPGRSVPLNGGGFDHPEATVVRTVTIPAGQVAISFSITGLDDGEDDGNQAVKVRATAYGFTPGVQTLTVTDND